MVQQKFRVKSKGPPFDRRSDRKTTVFGLSFKFFFSSEGMAQGPYTGYKVYRWILRHLVTNGMTPYNAAASLKFLLDMHIVASNCPVPVNIADDVIKHALLALTAANDGDTLKHASVIESEYLNLCKAFQPAGVAPPAPEASDSDADSGTESDFAKSSQDGPSAEEGAERSASPPRTRLKAAQKGLKGGGAKANEVAQDEGGAEEAGESEKEALPASSKKKPADGVANTNLQTLMLNILNGLSPSSYNLCSV